MESQFVWINFGVMAKPEENDRYLYAVNVAGDRAIMSKGKYPNWGRIREKLIRLEGKNCKVRTSQSTTEWATSVWFSDVDDGEQDLSPSRGVGQKTESMEDLKNKLSEEREKRQNVEAENYKLKSEVADKDGQLAETKKQLLKKEDDLQNEKAKNNELSTKLAEADLQISKLKDSPELEQKQIKKDQEDLDGKNLVGGKRKIRVKGHPKNTLALRLGLLIENDKLEVEITKSLGKGRFQVDFASGKTGIVVLGYDSEKDKIYAKTFFNMNEDWFDAEQKIIGSNEAALKDRTDISLEKFLEWHKKIDAHLSGKAQ